MLASLKLKDRAFDEKIEALNVFCTLQISDYLEIANNIKNNNDFQRRKVQNRSTVYSLLKDDLLDGCLIPSIVLALDEKDVPDVTRDSNDSEIIELIKANGKKLKILDGLQRTNILLDIALQLNNLVDSREYEKFLSKNIRLEIYIGISRFGVLYRMLTLNTGQTQMSLRHQIEILYSDLFDRSVDGIQLLRDAVDKGPQRPAVGRYLFSDIIEGVTSYIEGSEFTLDRFDLLEYIKTLKRLSKETVHQDFFKSYLAAYHSFLSAITDKSNNWKFTLEGLLTEQQDVLKYNEKSKELYLFGASAEEIFTRPQIYTAFGAALYSLKFRGVISDTENIESVSNKIFFDISVNYSLNNLIVRLAQIKRDSKKIGDSQRTFFKYFFENILDRNKANTYLNFDASVDTSYRLLYSPH